MNIIKLKSLWKEYGDLLTLVKNIIAIIAIIAVIVGIGFYIYGQHESLEFQNHKLKYKIREFNFISFELQKFGTLPYTINSSTINAGSISTKEVELLFGDDEFCRLARKNSYADYYTEMYNIVIINNQIKKLKNNIVIIYSILVVLLCFIIPIAVKKYKKI